MQKEELQKLIEERYVTDENGVIVDLKENEENRLALMCKEWVFDWCGCYPTNYNLEGLKKMIREWWDNTGKRFINDFVKSPNYNGEYAWESSEPIQRSIDKDGYMNFLNRLRSWLDYVMIPHKINDMSYSEVRSMKDDYENRIYHASEIVEYASGLTDIIAEWESKRDEFEQLRLLFRQKWNDGELAKRGAEIYSLEEVQERDNYSDILRHLIGKPTQFIDKETEEYINAILPKFKAKEGQKTSRVVNKIATAKGLNKITWDWIRDKGLTIPSEYVAVRDNYFNTGEKPNAYNPMFADFADTINPFVVDKHLFISFHPIDYLTMSWLNDTTSCHTTDKENKHGYNEDNYHGMYSSGCESYMKDGVSLVMYILSSNAVEKAIERDEPVPRKEMRQMFHIGKEKFVQGRLYPYDQTDRGRSVCFEQYEQYRAIMQKVLSELWGCPNLWTNKKGTSSVSSWVNSYGTHYRDYTCYENCNISFLKDFTNQERIEIGSDPICPVCGEHHRDSENCFCSSCREEFYCAYHDEYETGTSYNVRGYGRVCRDAIDSELGYRFERCENCGEYYDVDEADYVETEDGNRYCCTDCANSSGYYYLERYDGWYYEDEFTYSEVENCDILYDDDNAIDGVIYNERGWTTIAFERNCFEYDGEWYYDDCGVEDYNGDTVPEWLTVEAYVGEEETDTVLEDNCTLIDGEWYADDVVVEVEDEYAPEWVTAEIDGKYYFKEDCIEYKGDYYLPKDCIDVDGTMTPIDMSEMLMLDRIELAMAAVA